MKMRRCEVRRCEDEKMRDRPPLLEEPCAQTLSGTMENHHFLWGKSTISMAMFNSSVVYQRV